MAALAACSEKAPAEAVKPGAEVAGKPVVAVDVVKAEKVPFTFGVPVVGTLSPKFEAMVRAEVKTRVTDVYVSQWVPVSKGAELSKSDTRDIESQLASAKAALSGAKSQEEAAGAQLQIIEAQKQSLKAQEEAAKAGVAEAQVALERAEREFKRLTSLSESGLVTRQSLDEAGTALAAAKARVDSARAQIRTFASQIDAADAQAAAAKSSRAAAAANAAAAAQQVSGIETTLSKAVIRSPMNGIVAERFVNVGDLPGDTALFRIVDNRVLNLTVSVPMREQGAVKVGQTLEFSTDALPGETFAGVVMFINPVVNQSDRSVDVLAEVQNPDGRLKGGMFVKGKIVEKAGRETFAVARSALAAWDTAAKSAEIFIVADGVAKKRKVATGNVSGDLVEVVSGLSGGEAVVVRGGFNLREGDKVAAGAAGEKK